MHERHHVVHATSYLAAAHFNRMKIIVVFYASPMTNPEQLKTVVGS